MRTEGCELCWGEVAGSEVRLRTALALAKTEFAQGQVQEEPLAPAGRLSAQKLPA